MVLRKGYSGDSSTDHETPVDGSSSFPHAEDLERYELMQAEYLKVGQDFDTQEEFLGEGYDKLLRLETVPRRWPLAIRFHYKELLLILIVLWLAAAGRSYRQDLCLMSRWRFFLLAAAWVCPGRCALQSAKQR